MALALATAFSAVSPLAIANPQAGVAIHGQISTNSPAANKLNVITTNGAGTNHSAINWQSFSIPAGSTTNFQQPSATSLSINRVVTNTPSALFGTLSSNGRLVLVNQSGIAVGAGAVIDTAGFTASALRMSDADALAGRLRFGEAGTGSGANITIGGRIIARDGDVVLIAPNIELGGTAFLTALNGSTVLAAGQQVEITGRGLEGIKMLVQAPTDAVRNLGMLQGDAVGIFAGTLRHSGEIQATTAAMEGGQVVLKATGDAIVDGAAKILATGGAGAKGGRVDVLGTHVAVMDHAVIDASGGTGGGTIRVGGDFQGKNVEVPNANVTYFGKEVQLKADAIESGNGGKVIVWADDTTRAYGSISAKGGATSGDGGFVEVSGKHHLTFAAKADTSAPTGKTGKLLLDPSNLEIASFLPTSGGNFSGSLPVIFSSSAADSDVAWADIVINLASSNVEITTSSAAGFAGVILVQDGVAYSSTNSLSFYAHSDITINGSISNLSSGDIKAYAGWDGSGGSQTVVSGAGNITVNSLVNTLGAIDFKVGGTINLASGLSAASVSLDAFGSGNAIVVNGAISASGSFAATTHQSNSVMQVNNSVSSVAAMNLSLAGGLTVQSSGSQFAGLQAATSQTITAKYVEVLAGGTMGASINTTGGGQTIATSGKNSTGEGLLVQSTGTSNFATINASGPQSITVSDADAVRVRAMTAGGAAEVRSSSAQTFTMTGAGLNQLVVGHASGQGNASISGALQSITAGIGSQAGGITLLGGTINGVQSYITNSLGTQTISTTGDITLTAGTASGGSGAVAQIYSGAAAAQSIAAHNISLTGGAIGSANGAFIQANNAASTQSITIAGGSTLALTGGSGSGTGNRASIFSSGTSQTIHLGSISLLRLLGGTVGAGNVANIYQSNAAGTQTVNGSSATLAIEGGATGGVTSNGNRAVLESAGSQQVTGNTITLLGGNSGTENFAQIHSAKNQTLNVGSGGLSMTGGSGNFANPKNFASVFQSGTTGFSQTINVSSGGDVFVRGGSTSSTTVADGSSGSFSYIRADGDAQLIEFTGTGSVIQMFGGTVGVWNQAGIYAKYGTQTIQGSSLVNAPTITISGGASGGADGKGNSAGIFADVGVQTITASAISLQGGSGGLENTAGISSNGSDQFITATGITISGGSGGGLKDAGNRGSIYSGFNQTITVGAVGINLYGGAGTGNETDNEARILQDGGMGTSQTITVNSGGNINITGGSSFKINVDGSGHGSRAHIESEGDSQSINFTAGGNIYLEGGTNGSRAFANIYAGVGSLTQTITGVNNITIHGGSSGGVAGEGNNAGIGSDGVLQTITSNGFVTLTGGVGGVDNSAYITAANQSLDFGGNLTLTGSNGGDSNSGARIGGRGGSSPSNTNLSLAVGGDLTLQAGSSSGVAIGSTSAGTGLTNTIDIIAVGNVDLSPMVNQGVRIGAHSSNVTAGDIQVTSNTGSINLNSLGSTGSSIRTLGNLTLAATFGQISESTDSVIQAALLTANTDGAISLDSANNQVISFNASNSTGGDITFTNKAGSSLTVTGLTVVGGDAIISADDINITGPIQAGTARVFLRPNTLARDVNIEASATTNSLSLSPTELAFVNASELEIGRLDGTGNVNIRTGLARADINTGLLRLVSGNNINSTSGGNIGALASESDYSLVLQAANDINLTNGNIVLGDGWSLTVQADHGQFGVSDGVGNVNIGGGRFQVGSTVGNTGTMTISGENITVALSGNSQGVVYVQGTGAQTFSAAGNLTFANNNTGFGTLLVVAEKGQQNLAATNGMLNVSAGTGTGTSAFVGTGDQSTAGQFINARGMSISGGASGGATVGGSTNDRNLAQVYANAEQTILLGGGGLSLTGGGGSGNSTGNMASLLAHGDQAITVADGGHVTLQGGSSAGQNVVDNNGSLAYITSDGDQTLMFTGTDVFGVRSVISITGGSNGSGNNAGILSTGGSQIIAGSSPGYNPTIIMQGGSGGGGTKDNSVAIVSLMTQGISSANLSLAAGTGVSNNGAFVASQIQQIDVTGNLSMTGGSATAVGGVRIGGLASGGPGNTALNLQVSGDLTLTGGLTSGAGIGSSPFQTGLSNTITIVTGGNVLLNSSATAGAGIGYLGAAFATDGGGGNINITSTNGRIAINESGLAGLSGIRTLGNVTLTANAVGKTIYGSTNSIVLANALATSSGASTNLIGSGNVAQNFSGTSMTGSVVYNSNSLNLLNVGAVSGNTVGITNGAGGIEFIGNVNANANLSVSTAGEIYQSGGVITVTGSTSIFAGSNVFLASSLNDFKDVAMNVGGDIILKDSNNVSITTSTVGGITLESGGNITMLGQLTSTSNFSDAIELKVGAGGVFNNVFGATALNATNGGNWLVYSNDPANDTKGGLVYNFKEYNTTVHSQGTGNGFVYAVNPAAITAATMTGGTISKVYNSDFSADLSGAVFSGVGIDGDQITLSGAGSGLFQDKNVGTGKLVDVSGLSVSGATNGGATVFGYTSNLTTFTVGTGVITPASLTFGLGVDNKTYDRTTTASPQFDGAPIFGLQGADSVTINGATANFVDFNAGVGKQVNITGITLGGAAAANYTFSTTATTTANIDPAEITSIIGIVAQNKTYDGTNVATLNTSGASFAGTVYAGDVLKVGGGAVGTFSDKNVGSPKPVTITGLTLNGPGSVGAANYILTSTTASSAANITKADLIVAGITASKVYNGNTAATVQTSGATLVGKVAGDDLSLVPTGVTAVFQDANAGTGKALTVSGIALTGDDMNNYNLVGSTYTGDVSRVALTTWTGSANDGMWSSPNNWSGNLAPTASNFERVSILSGLGSVQFNGNVSLLSMTSERPFDMSGGNLGISSDLSASAFTQTGGTLSVASNFSAGSYAQSGSSSTSLGSMNITGAASLMGGNLNVATSLKASSFTQTDGTLSSLGTMTISGTISQTKGAIVSPDFTVSSVGGMSLNSLGNQISKLTATNTGSGDIVIQNTALLSVMGLTNRVGNIDLNNIGGITTLGKSDASGNLKITANSPLTVGLDGGVSAGGNVSLIATNLTSTGNLTLDGPVNGNTVLLDAAGNMAINGEVIGINGITAKAGGSLSFGVLSRLTGTPTTYSAGGFISDQRGGASQGGSATLTAFLDLFEKALDEQISLAEETNPDGSKKRRGVDDTIVTEGETCRP